ncbi:Methyltransferase type 11 [Methanohalobium evestigatum Z-7303]|uniref:Methyltransferase type 11 n=1 Tax=Methanohalobium evestigatum (strain ATCC BAA-1072 / DSM 3721 / NBRC 107634 / OCM 161 / Z-7303) TaxID=644295 RepID=D7E776_METEZ|nr:class I SAM-dependent methyltransferase [Methanohalobium evestigatum]ADI73825.1 Methyltransferase type 11 [Methanohalobium evestigatum Z-7303]
MSESGKTAVDKAQEYYNSNDADNFYFTIWGGEDIHVGLYQSEDEPIFDASRRTVERMASKINNLNKNSKILDIGAGYGGAARYLARNNGCQVVALNLSEVENERDRKMNEEQALDHLITVVDGSFENLPYPDDSFDVVWSQDSILHSGEREQVIKEVARVLKSGGDFIFTDPMQTDDCPEGVLQPILDRIHLESLGSPGFYRESAKKYGMKEIEFEEHTSQLPTHYGRVLKETKRREDELSNVVSQEYINNMKQGLQHWVNGGNSGYLTWGIFHFRKE